MANKKPSDLEQITERNNNDVFIVEQPDGSVKKDTRASITERYEYVQDDRNDQISDDFYYYLFTKSTGWQIRRQGRDTGFVSYVYGDGDWEDVWDEREYLVYST